VILLKSLFFSFFLCFWTALWGILCSPILILPAGHKIFPKFGYIWAKIIILGLKLICGISYKVLSLHKIPNRPSIIVAKHQSAWETIFLLYLLKNPVFVIKNELTSIPIYGWYLGKMSMMAIDRKSGVNAIKQVKDGARIALNSGRHVVIFPEGTRVKPSDSKPYRSGVKMLRNAYSNVPIVPIALNSGQYWINGTIIKKPGTIILKVLNWVPQKLPNDALMDYLKKNIDIQSDKLCRNHD
jgi:1-acyl-sn-glycerol-3-phosphate acyltransferase